MSELGEFKDLGVLSDTSVSSEPNAWGVLGELSELSELSEPSDFNELSGLSG